MIGRGVSSMRNIFRSAAGPISARSSPDLIMQRDSIPLQQLIVCNSDFVYRFDQAVR